MANFRMNKLTKDPGGYFLDLLFSDGTKQRTINTKSPYHYLMTVITESALEGNTVERAYTSAGKLVYENGRFNEEFISKNKRKMFF